MTIIMEEATEVAEAVATKDNKGIIMEGVVTMEEEEEQQQLFTLLECYLLIQ